MVILFDIVNKIRLEGLLSSLTYSGVLKSYKIVLILNKKS